ncbi:siderophore-interacting protein [Catenuloplanes atrovinosus]|uniref:NADPH-dependent ferric siderophore reductase n=1 Tax=Catenuloplanes atrovinosus TaxID=137266 RepID=A0AAE3YMT6_9ACTN|nr:siderophore-interacting protein [Catenuloplanes atrovinosus]MDR7276668.1 NADPH-dependent ferric siderophore reductase [Catenuloplanes atrovinosus]
MTQPTGRGTAAREGGRGAGLVRRVSHQERRRRLEVLRVEELSPTMRRVVLGGPELEADFPWVPLAAADHVRIVVPDPETGELALPAPGRRDASAIRDYTPRRFDADAVELTLDFVLHAHGPAGRWATTAAPGDALGVIGPRVSQVFPADCDDYLLIADETGLPAAERFLEELPPEAVVRVLVLAEGPERVLGGGRPADLRRLGAAPVETVIDAVRGVPIGPGSFVWGAGEAAVMRALRTHFRHERGLPAERVAVRGYWREGAAGALSGED